MKILFDENIPLMTGESLRGDGHDVKDIRRSSLQGINDAKLWELAQAEKRLLISTDKGFTRLRNSNHYGLLVVLLSRPNRKAIHDRVIMAIKQQHAPSWRGLTVVVRDNVKSIFKRKIHR